MSEQNFSRRAEWIWRSRRLGGADFATESGRVGEEANRYVYFSPTIHVPACRVREVACTGRRTLPLDSDLPSTHDDGGHTSAKVAQADLLTGERTGVLWEERAGGDVGSMKLHGFATLDVDKSLALGKLYRGHALADEVVGYLPHGTFNFNTRAASIDTPPHALLPHAHVDPATPPVHRFPRPGPSSRTARSFQWHRACVQFLS